MHIYKILRFNYPDCRKILIVQRKEKLNYINKNIKMVMLSVKISWLINLEKVMTNDAVFALDFFNKKKKNLFSLFVYEIYINKN